VSNTCCVCVAVGSARRLDRRTPAGDRRQPREGTTAMVCRHGGARSPLPAEPIRRRVALDLVAPATGEVNW
jgi:hypothetical protein